MAARPAEEKRATRTKPEKDRSEGRTTKEARPPQRKAKKARERTDQRADIATSKE
jgi:hypothetical protein